PAARRTTESATMVAPTRSTASAATAPIAGTVVRATRSRDARTPVARRTTASATTAGRTPCTRSATWVRTAPTAARADTPWPPGLLGRHPRSPRLDGVGEQLEDRHRLVPTNARIGDALTVDRLLAARPVLAARDEVALDHRADDRTRSGRDLIGDVPCHLEL